MIISHKYKFIFVKTAKTAGTSIEVELNKILGAEDVATPIFPSEKSHLAQNYSYTDPETGDEKLFRNHQSAREIKKIVGTGVFQSYFKFCVDREPVDKCISHFSMFLNSPNHQVSDFPKTWDDYVKKGRFPLGVAAYTCSQGMQLVDRILKYENLSEELFEVSRMLGFQFDGLHAKAKAGFRENVTVTPEQRHLIYKKFKHTAKFTGYTLS
ncbi:MAG: sulfotransferase family 2 domain-containing protein [Pseudomonadota bacterium]